MERFESIDFDRLGDALGGPVWIPAGEPILAREIASSSQRGVEDVTVYTRTANGTLRRVDTGRTAAGYRTFQDLARNLCSANDRDFSRAQQPGFPDDLAMATVDAGGRSVDCFVLHWRPVRIVMMEYDHLRVYATTLDEEPAGTRLVQARGIHRLVPP
jgi:hypothetical protein